MRYNDMNSLINEEVIVSGEEAIKNAIKNIMTSNFNSIPGNPAFGTNLISYIFADTNVISSLLIKQEFEAMIPFFEPRIRIIRVNVKEDLDYNRILVNIHYSIKGETDEEIYKYLYSITK